jgi:hypothetical protein
MNGGEISGNSSGYGGGVSVNPEILESTCTFIMTGGEIYGNSAIVSGGGVWFYSYSSSSPSNILAKTGGVIYGYDSAHAEDPKNNVVKDSSNVIKTASGHAVYGSIRNGHDTYRKETTVGPEDNLFYNDPVNGTSGWD